MSITQTLQQGQQHAAQALRFRGLMPSPTATDSLSVLSNQLQFQMRCEATKVAHAQQIEFTRKHSSLAKKKDKREHSEGEVSTAAWCSEVAFCNVL